MSKTLLAFLFSTLLLGTISTAAGPNRDGPPNPEQSQEMRALKAEQAKLRAKEHLLQLKQALNLAQNQMPVWTTYETHMLDNAGNHMKMIKKLKQSQADTGKPPSSIQMAEMNVERLEQQLETAKERLAVFSKLYAVLNEEQRATVDKLAHQKVRRAAGKVRSKKMEPRDDN